MFRQAIVRSFGIVALAATLGCGSTKRPVTDHGVPDKSADANTDGPAIPDKGRIWRDLPIFQDDLYSPADHRAPKKDVGPPTRDLFHHRDAPVMTSDAYPYDLPPLPPQGKAVDILFVVDSSHSMEQEQKNLIDNFPRLLDGLRRHSLGADGSGKPCTPSDTAGCNIPDLHIGVITTDLGAGSLRLGGCEPAGDQGKLQSKARRAGCTPPSDPWIAYDGKTSNVSKGSTDHIERVKQAFGCIADVGIAGCGFEQTIESARRALDPRLNVNPGFVRQDALLVVIFVTDEDDCSVRDARLFDIQQGSLLDPLGPLTSFRCFEFGVQCDVNDRHVLGPRTACRPATSAYFWPIENHIRFFLTLKPPGWVLMGAIAGPTAPVAVEVPDGIPSLAPSCRGAAGLAVPGIRLKAVVDAFHGPYSSICEADFGPALEGIGKLVAL